MKADRLMEALTRYVRAEIDARTVEQDEDSMGAYYEEQELRKAVEELFPDVTLSPDEKCLK